MAANVRVEKHIVCENLLGRQATYPLQRPLPTFQVGPDPFLTGHRLSLKVFLSKMHQASSSQTSVSPGVTLRAHCGGRLPGGGDVAGEVRALRNLILRITPRCSFLLSRGASTQDEAFLYRGFHGAQSIPHPPSFRRARLLEEGSLSLRST